MAQAQEQILPKGIVFNRNAIYEEIAKFPVVPVEQILRACHVFSITARETSDPTARRLENFWTRVLGGDRRYLSGAIIAQLFKDISEKSFVKLRGPLNRYEPPSPPKPSDSNVYKLVKTTSEMSASRPKSGATTPLTKPLHPILKKPRGPSASGPRPTARFVSPHASPAGSELEDDGDRGSGTSSQDPGSSSTTEGKKRKQASKLKKKTTTFVASTSSRRRPTMPRRTSSQSSAGVSDKGSKEGSSLLGANYDGSQSSVPTIPERPEQQSTSTNKQNINAILSAAVEEERARTPSHGKETRPKAGNMPSGRSRSEIASSQQSGTKVEPGGSMARKGRQEKGAAANSTRSETFHPMTLLHKGFSEERSNARAMPSLNKSLSDIGSSRPTLTDTGRSVLIAPSSLTVAKLDTSVIGQGTISGFAGSMPNHEAVIGQSSGQSDAPEGLGRASESSEASSLAPRILPAQPSNIVALPLSRSKSQLKFVLEQQGGKKQQRH